jgi:hypothetical protein
MNQSDINRKQYGRSFWGPRLWYIIHKISYNLPEIINLSDQQFLMKYFSIIAHLIPCPYCSYHFISSMNTKLLNRNLSSRQSVVEWFKNQHNDVNLMNRGRVYQGFEIDQMYEKTPFQHNYFKELIDYLFNRVISGEVNRKVFIHWVLMTFKIHPCPSCKTLGAQYFLKNDIEHSSYFNDDIVKKWLDGLFIATKH